MFGNRIKQPQANIMPFSPSLLKQINPREREYPSSTTGLCPYTITDCSEKWKIEFCAWIQGLRKGNSPSREDWCNQMGLEYIEATVQCANTHTVSSGAWAFNTQAHSISRVMSILSPHLSGCSMVITGRENEHASTALSQHFCYFVPWFIVYKHVRFMLE